MLGTTAIESAGERDEPTGAGRPTLVCGSAGAGKTLFAMEFLVRGALLYNEPGVFISFEETDEG